VFQLIKCLSPCSRFDADEAGYDMQPNGKKEITPLPRVDHSRQNYVEIEKCFYEEHEDIAKLSDDQVRQIRMDLGKLACYLTSVYDLTYGVWHTKY
jgi:hypothetical protein